MKRHTTLIYIRREGRRNSAYRPPPSSSEGVHTYQPSYLHITSRAFCFLFYPHVRYSTFSVRFIMYIFIGTLCVRVHRGVSLSCYWLALFVKLIFEYKSFTIIRCSLLLEHVHVVFIFDKTRMKVMDTSIILLIHGLLVFRHCCML
ncbi:hypothetical protein F4808DRAFT_253856 [Astrocystis sublimbata]|nr:hypothetical protein F4808DRAFT_253856 [Astrocystis sublimbata]